MREEKNQSDRRPLRSCLSLKFSPSFDEGSLFRQGYFSVQDEASQLIASLVDPKEGETIIDACCGPGGKLGHLYELSEGKARLIAVERDAKQMERAQDNMIRLGHLLHTPDEGYETIEWQQRDFLEFRPKEIIDKILLDAPCSGLGVLRRHPEGKWQKGLGLLPLVVKQQRELLLHSLSLLPPGGELIYSVCSYEKEETEEQLAWLKKEHGDLFEQLSPLPRLPDYYKRFVTRDHILLIYSGNKDDMDGFGAFILKKK